MRTKDEIIKDVERYVNNNSLEMQQTEVFRAMLECFLDIRDLLIKTNDKAE
jgi:hypothetical protein